ncbi:uncharacterized protein LOC132720669 isoform X2 [Ruditapes philippinarum]|uniref:uncharacterized protein LOC132720669 isoform X2 n=1 Tax=Ruditapes philippinarum TaxID=129788 RepID=UPI00295B9767|nr:uncharacterized protein LOC132720669 isoform X2 [Ruditapes philippinarum]
MTIFIRIVLSSFIQIWIFQDVLCTCSGWSDVNTNCPEAHDVQMNLNDGVLTPKTSLHTTLSQKSTLRFSASQQGSWDGTCIYVYQGQEMDNIHPFKFTCTAPRIYKSTVITSTTRNIPQNVKRFDTGLVAGVIVGLLILNALVAVGYVCIRRKCKINKENGQTKEAVQSVSGQLAQQSLQDNQNTGATNANAYERLNMHGIGDQRDGDYQQLKGEYEYVYEDTESNDKDRDTGTVQQMAGNVSMHPGTNVEIGEQTVQLYSEIQPENIVNVYEQLSSYKNDNPAVDMYQQLDFK